MLLKEKGYAALSLLAVLAMACSEESSGQGDGLSPGDLTGPGLDRASPDSQAADGPLLDSSTLDGPTPDGYSGADGFPAPAPDACIKNTAAGQRAYTCGGLTFDVTVPAKCLTSPCGLVVDVHGFTMSAGMQDANTGMRALGKKHGYIVVQPNAKPAPPLSSWSLLDDAKVYKFIQRVISVWHADKKRVHFTGFSQGGAMSWRFLCKHGDLLASVAPAAACTATQATGCFGGGKTPKWKIPVLYMHGTKDVLAQYSCAEKVITAVAATWKLSQKKVLSQDGSHTWTRYADGKGGLFEHLKHDYKAKSPLIGGHCYPGSKDLNGGAPGQLFGFACVEKSAFVWGESVMKFFISNPRK